MVAQLEEHPAVSALSQEVLEAERRVERDGDQAAKHEGDEEGVVARADGVVHVRAVVVEGGDAPLELAAMLGAQRARDVASVAERANRARLLNPAVRRELEGAPVLGVCVARRVDAARVSHVGSEDEHVHAEEGGGEGEVAHRRVHLLREAVVRDGRGEAVDPEEVKHDLVRGAALSHDRVEAAHEWRRVERRESLQHVPVAALARHVDGRAPLVVLELDELRRVGRRLDDVLDHLQRPLR
mmetsp:Transcript_9087/g.28787  ORF Transcript_9087/g.28787 Transcript_9087/m.28787 type:complete len:241 (-) Transcript_9087:704-1426(-)